MPGETIVLDANLLVLLVVGTASLSYITRHKRLRAYTERDFTLLANMLASVPGVILTPNTVTEASNLIGYIDEPARSRIYTVLRKILTTTDEIYYASKQAAEHTAFLRLGITDAVLLNIAAPRQILLTTDLDLYLAAARQGHIAINFNHLMEANR
jgi:hypothetical protein